ncbi:metallophosphoesterase [Caldibacillus lycopersici]|uniref:Metallophosphoesterase n=1 Tax=Perspicuibacillus lycopersici TaxID=1325689 RepID=A0AAE3LN46_9BACI|nr:metallophosphoesterase [Perspicuibacillus lycopersici]MCU9613571.1 metallophosphoesterase [Perspicuibacillus lycopersici]
MNLYLVITAIVIISMLFFKAYQNTKKVNIQSIAIPQTNKLINKLTIFHLSDIHLENISVTPEEIVLMAQNQQIDLIALTGDFLDRKRTIPKLVPYIQALKQLNPRYGMYAVFGNHDYVLKGNHFAQLKDVLESNGCITLQNEHISLTVDGDIVNIIGIDDYSTKRSNINDSFRDLQEGYNLVLTHDPNVVLEMPNIPFDYLLSGHFHGGQIHWPKPYHLAKMGKLARQKVIKGLHYHKGKPFYISEGLGQTGLNIRVGSRPEVTFHQIGNQSSQG